MFDFFSSCFRFGLFTFIMIYFLLIRFSQFLVSLSQFFIRKEFHVCKWNCCFVINFLLQDLFVSFFGIVVEYHTLLTLFFSFYIKINHINNLFLFFFKFFASGGVGVSWSYAVGVSWACDHLTPHQHFEFKIDQFT